MWLGQFVVWFVCPPSYDKEFPERLQVIRILPKSIYEPQRDGIFVPTWVSHLLLPIL